MVHQLNSDIIVIVNFLVEFKDFNWDLAMDLLELPLKVVLALTLVGGVLLIFAITSILFKLIIAVFINYAILLFSI
jgi:hypothetical protein